MKDWSFPPWRRSLLGCVAGATAGAAWTLSWRMLGAPYSAADMASSSIGITLAITLLVAGYPARDQRERGKGAAEASSAAGLGRRILLTFEPVDFDHPGSGFPRMSSAILRMKLVMAVVMVSCFALPLGAAGVWSSRLDIISRLGIILTGLVLAAIFSYSGACAAYTLRRRRKLGRN